MIDGKWPGVQTGKREARGYTTESQQQQPLSCFVCVPVARSVAQCFRGIAAREPML